MNNKEILYYLNDAHRSDHTNGTFEWYDYDSIKELIQKLEDEN